MASPPELIRHLKHRHPATWSLVKLAASQGLVEFGPTGNVFELSPDLQQLHPRLHQILAGLLEEDAESPEATIRMLFDDVPGADRHGF